MPSTPANSQIFSATEYSVTNQFIITVNASNLYRVHNVWKKELYQNIFFSMPEKLPAPTTTGSIQGLIVSSTEVSHGNIMLLASNVSTLYIRTFWKPLATVNVVHLVLHMPGRLSPMVSYGY